MNREIKFRGKRVNSGEWVFGYLFVGEDLDEYFIQGYNYYRDECGKQREPYWYKVIPETVGQYTGLKDKNGVEIYEGDIIQSNKSKYKRFNDDGIYEVYFNDFLCHYALIASMNQWEIKNGQYDNYSLTGAKTKDFEVIGNIYENET